MMKYYKEPEGATFPQLEEEILREWKDQDILRKIKERMRDGEPLVFCEGPPTANSRPHIGDALTRAVKDAFLRYFVMNGRKIVPYIGGWDCHGLPVEIEIERSLGIQSKKEIESLGIAKFNQLCRDSVVKYKAEWEQMSRRIGYSIDYENAYLTMSNEYIESVWWSMKELHSKGLLTKEREVVPYCPRCGTPLSTHEFALGAKHVESREVIVKMRLDALDASVLVLVTEPWRLVANALLAVDKDRSYVAFIHGPEKLIVAEDRLPFYSESAVPIAKMTGSELMGKRYEPPFRYHEFKANAFTIVHSDAAWMSDENTGVVSIAPSTAGPHFEIGEAAGVEFWDPIGMDGRFAAEVPELAGKLATDCDAEVMRLLESRDLLFGWELVKDSAWTFCWRCDTALQFKALDSWFVRVPAAKNRLVDLNNQILWVPDTMKLGRFGNFLSDARDWAVSRSRYWGTPLPIWRCENGHEICIGSINELREMSEGKLPDDLDLHRPWVDAVRLRCPTCGRSMARDESVLDCWYDSGCAPFAQYHYPFENIAEFDSHRSVDFVAETVDQTRGWFYTQHALSVLLFDKPAFLSVLVLGQVLDKDGKRMTMSSNNLIFPDDVFSTVGADASRLYLLGNPVWQSVQFSTEQVRGEMVAILTTLLNVYSFFASNANAYGFRQQKEYAPTHDLDRWIRSRLSSSVKEARAGFDALEVHRAVHAIESFVEDLSSWYVRRSRRRFWEENDPQDRFSAHCTLNECLVTLSKLMAPITPFFADWMYKNLHGPKESVHLEDYPPVNDDLINGTLERQMALVMTAVEAGRLARQKVNAKLRQPLPEVVIAADTDRAWTLRRFEKMIAEELNVKKVEVIESRDKMVQFAVAPNLKTLGPKLKEGASEVSELLSKVDENELVKHLRTKGKIRLGGFDLTEEDVIVSEKEKHGFSHASVGDIHVYIALEVTQNLKLEGLSREIIRRIQHMRKELKLEFEDPVDVEYFGHHDLETALSVHRDHIMRETHARALVRKESIQNAQKWTINKMLLELSVRRIER
jgi:isoleucyl-tRNA synthetase